LLVDFLLTLRQSFPLLSFQRNSVYLRFCHCDYHKGSTLLRVAQEIGIASTSILAAGDNHNDLQMLDPTYAGYLVCPSNSVPEVRAKVALHAPFGFISSKKFGAGTAEGIWKFLQ
ncbi:MAG: HAD hydrolase family protein, partial [Chthoniobacterales bacterium]|nr:HAD hydrolase family protein [Chthoniobacterales bacterium]